MKKDNVYLANFTPTDKSRVGFTNDFQKCCYNLTLLSSKLLYCLISQNKRIDSDPFGVINISVDKFASICEIAKRSAYRSLVLAAEGLLSSFLDVPAPLLPKHLSRSRVAWVSLVNEYKGQGGISLKLNPDLQPFFLGLKNQFTLVPLTDLCKFSSTYSQRLYMFLCQYQHIGKSVLSITELRYRLNLGVKYKDYKDFRRRVLNVAVEEINKITDLRPVTYEPKKDGGRSYTSLCFMFTPRSPMRTIENADTGEITVEMVK